jgi:hypothetical protein
MENFLKNINSKTKILKNEINFKIKKNEISKNKSIQNINNNNKKEG